MRIDLELHGDVQVSRELIRFSGRTDDASPAFRAIATIVRRSERRQFATGGKHASGGWAKLKPATLASKRRLVAQGKAKYSRKILALTGDLMESLTKRGSGTGGAVRLVEPHQLVYGTELPYAKFHQHGTERMAQRRPLEVRGRDRTEMVKTLQRYLVTGRVRERA